MKAKIQIIIGLVTATVSIVGIVILFGGFVIAHLFSDYAPHAPYMLFLLGLILPGAYGFALIKKKLKQVRNIFFVWCVCWLISFILWSLEYAVFYHWLEYSLPTVLDEIMIFLEAIIVIPTCAFLYPLVDIFNVYEYSLTLRAINGVIFMLLLWAGVKGLKKMVDAETEQKQ